MPTPSEHPPPVPADIVPSGSSEHTSAATSDPTAGRALASLPEGSYPANLGQLKLYEAAQYVTDVVATALMYLKLPLAVLLAVVIGGLGLFGMFHLILGAIHGSFAAVVHGSTHTVGGIIRSFLNLTRGSEDVLQQLLSFNITSVAAEGVLCALPLSLLALCDTRSSGVGGVPPQPDYPTLIEVQGRAFDHLLGQSETGIAISLDIKHAEIVVRDLVAVIHASDLLKRDLIASALDDFVLDARLAGRALQKLSVKIYSSTDKYVYTHSPSRSQRSSLLLASLRSTTTPWARSKRPAQPAHR